MKELNYFLVEWSLEVEGDENENEWEPVSATGNFDQKVAESPEEAIEWVKDEIVADRVIQGDHIVSADEDAIIYKSGYNGALYRCIGFMATVRG